MKLIDCLTRSGVIVDDADKWAEIRYAQATGGKCTIITVSDMEAV